jgi:transposase
VLALEIRCLHHQLAARNRELFRNSRSEQRPVEPEAAPRKERKPRTVHGRTAQPRLPVRVQVHTLDEADLACADCGEALRVMDGQLVEAEEITVARTRYELVQHKRQKYRCTCCDHIDTALGPQKLMPGSLCSPVFAVHVAVDKYADGLALERQGDRMQRAGLDVTSATLWDRLVALYHRLLPTLLALHAWLLTQPVVHADASPWRVMGKGKSARWSVSTESGVHDLLAPTRGKDAARVLLGGFTGVADADGAYRAERARRAEEAMQPGLLDGPIDAPVVDDQDRADNAVNDADVGTQSGHAEVSADGPAHDADVGAQSRLAEALDEVGGLFRLAGCRAHARRPFFHAEKNFPEVAPVRDLIAQRYRIQAAAEEAAKVAVLGGADPVAALRARRAERRLRESTVVIEEIRTWRKAQVPIPKSKFADDVRYLRLNWLALTMFLTNPDVPLDAGMAERAQRPTVFGGKIHLGARSERGTRVSAAMFSLVHRARPVGVDPADYLRAAVMLTLSDPRCQAVLLPRAVAAQVREADAAS